MKLKDTIPCQYCLAQGITMEAKMLPKSPPVKPTDVRYGCDNGHFFAVPRDSVQERE